MRYFLAIPIVLVAGYIIARNHHRLRDFGIGTAVGSALPPLPDLSEHDHGTDHHHGHETDGGGSHVDSGDDGL
jgi:hypothetical protein